MRRSIPSGTTPASTRIGVSGGACLRALSTRLATTRSRSARSATTAGRSSVTSTSTRAARTPSPATAASTTPSNATGPTWVRTAPDWSRLMSSRFSTRVSRRSVSSSIVRSNSARWSDDQVISVWRRLLIDALMPARGVRRSWDTAWRSAPRRSLAAASSVARPAWAWRRRVSTAVANWAARAVRTPSSADCRVRPDRVRTRSGPISRLTSAWRRSTGGDPPTVASITHRSPSRRNSAALVMAKVVRRWASRPGRASASASEPARVAMASASAWLRAACSRVRPRRSTSTATSPAASR